MSNRLQVLVTVGVVLLLALLGVGSSAAAATQDVSIKNFAFQPGALTVNIGDTVRWTNNDSAGHTTTSSAALWDSGRLGTGQTFDFTFTQAGSFAYICNIHPSMQGTIVVQGSPATTATPTTVTPTPVVSTPSAYLALILK